MTRIVAHRGASHAAPENTLAAFRAALAAGAEGVEFDVQLSRDGVPVVIHDETLERTTNGRGAVSAASAAELAALEAGAWFRPPVPGEGVPTLQAVLALLAPTALELHLELKTGRCAYPGLVPAVLRALEQAGLVVAPGRVWLSSFNHRTLAEAMALEPRLPCAALLDDVLIEPWRYAAAHGFRGIHPRYSQVDAALVQACHAAGLAVRVWTVDEEGEARRLLALGVEALMSNEPARLLRVRDAVGAER